MSSSDKNLKERAYRMLKEFFRITLYLWVVFGLLILYRSAILAKYDIDIVKHGLALINALALAKVMLVANDLHLGKKFDEHPLKYAVLVKAALFTLVLTCFKALEECVMGLFHHKSILDSLGDLGGGSWRGSITLTLLLFVILIPLVAYMELKRVLGEETVTELLRHRGKVYGDIQANAAS